MTELSTENQMALDDKIAVLEKHPQDEWLKLIWEWSGTRQINFAVFRGLLEHILEGTLKEALSG